MRKLNRRIWTILANRGVVAAITSIFWTAGLMRVWEWDVRYGSWPWWRIALEASGLYVLGLAVLWGVPAFLDWVGPKAEKRLKELEERKKGRF